MSPKAGDPDAFARSRRTLFLLSPFILVIDAWIAWSLYRALFDGVTYIRREGWRSQADDPTGFWISVSMDVLVALIFVGGPIYVLVRTRGLTTPPRPRAE